MVASILRSDDESSTNDEPTGKFKSKVHGCEVDLPRFATWLAMIPPQELRTIQEHPVTDYFHEAIRHIQDGVDIWDRESADELAASIRKAFLRELAAHPSTQHANEMFVKLGAMFGKNKSEIWAGIFAAASNGFLLLGHEENETEKDVENPSETLNEDIQENPDESEILEKEDDGPKRRKRFYRVNKKKLLQMELVAIEKSQQIAALAVALGPEEFSKRKENIKKQLTSKDENLKAQQAKEKVSEMLSKIDKNKTNVAMSKRGEDIPPRLLGYFPFNHLRKRVNVNELKKELDCRRVEKWDPSDGPKKGLTILKNVEKKRFEETVEKALLDRGKSFDGLSIVEKLTRLKETMKTNEESTNGEFDVDFSKFFKQQSTNLDVTIFEET